MLIFRKVVGKVDHTKTWKHATRAGHAQAEPLSSRQQLLPMRLLTRSISWTIVCKNNFGQSYHEGSWSYCTKISKPMPSNQFRNTTEVMPSCLLSIRMLQKNRTSKQTQNPGHPAKKVAGYSKWHSHSTGQRLPSTGHLVRCFNELYMVIS